MNEIRISRKTRNHGDDGHKIISLRLKVSVLERIEGIAIKTDRSRNELINILLEAALDNVTVEE